MTTPQPPDNPGQHIQPQPAPSTFQVDIMRTNDGRSFVAIVFHTVHGAHFQFMDAVGAKNLAAALEQKASQMSTGLIIPNGSLPPAFGGPG